LRTSSITTTLEEIVYAPNKPEKYVAAGGSGVITSSTDAIHWTFRTSSISSLTSINGVIFAQDTYVVVDQDGVINASTDAITWVARTSGSGTTPFYTIGYGNGTYFTGTNTSNSQFSTDSIVWRSVSGLGGGFKLGSLYVNDTYFLVGTNGVVATSPIASVGSGGSGVKGGGGGGGGYDEVNNLAGSGGSGGDGYVRISWY
jgi:hypothetical protein